MITAPHDLLLPYQLDYVNDHNRFKAACWSRQTGKDFSSSNEVVRDSAATPKNTWMVAAPSERQALENLEKCKDWLAAYKVAIEDYTEERDSYHALLNRASIMLPNGSRIIAVPGRPETVRGFSTNALLTEFAFFEDPDATWRAIYPSITNPLRGGEKKMRIISTPSGKTGPGRRFYEIVRDNYLEPKEGRKVPWTIHFLPIQDAVARGLTDIKLSGQWHGKGWAWLQAQKEKTT
jgi:phage FluMu gp28-like protein